MGKYLPWNDFKTLNAISVYFLETGILVVLNCFRGKNLIYASSVRLIRESGLYNIAVKTINFKISVFYNMNQNSIIDFTKRYIKSEVTLYCRKCGPDFASQDEDRLNPDDTLPFIIVDCCLYGEEEI